MLNQDTTVGNLNFFKCAEGFLESFPQSVYQLSLVIRTAPGKILKVLDLFHKQNIIRILFEQNSNQNACDNIGIIFIFNS